MSTLLRALALIVLALGLTASAVAAPPERLDDFELSFPDGKCMDPQMGGFELDFRLQGTIVVHALSPTVTMETYPNFTISWSANGRTLTSRGPASVRFTYSDADHTSIVKTEVRGLLAAVTLPGNGAVLLETGLIVFPGGFFAVDPEVRHGPDGFRSAEDHEAFCAYFED